VLCRLRRRVAALRAAFCRPGAFSFYAMAYAGFVIV
jgi:hypothetical protein